MELEKTTSQKRSNDAKLHVTQLAERRQKEKSVAKVRVVSEAAQGATKQNKATEVATMQTVEAAIVQAEKG